ncbi:MAG: hypothetical protein AAB853_03795 [Patescibacteria group bacterium]
MPAKKKTQTKQAEPANPAVLYDILMGEIEQELTTRNLPLLRDIYENETPEEAKQRGARYREAFEEYIRLWETFLERSRVAFHTLKDAAFASLKERIGIEEAGVLSALEQEIDHA